MANKEGYKDPTAEIAISNVMRKKKGDINMYRYDTGNSYHYDMDLVTKEDGGPGSGNWGHGGRKGKVGGSAKGTGGVQHRTGTKETGYSSEAKKKVEAKSTGEGSRSSNGYTAKFDKKGAPTAEQLGFSDTGYKKAQSEYMDKKGIKHSWDLSSTEKQKITDEYTKNLPKRVKTEDCDYEIDHYDFTGGHFSYKGTYKGYTVGKEYDVPGKQGVKAKVASIHVYNSGKGEAFANYKDKEGIHGNYLFR